MLTNVVPRIALVGCGVWGQNHARNLGELGALAAIIDSDTGDKAQNYNVPTYDDIEEFLQNGTDNIDAIIIAAPDIYHFDMAMRALDAGLDLFVEKPLTMDLAQAKILCERANAQNKILMVGHLLRYHTGFDCLLKTAKAGMIGALTDIISIRHDIFETPRDFDLIWGYGPHDASMIMALAAGDKLTSCGFYGEARQECIMSGQFESGLQATVSLSWRTPKKRFLIATGTEGQLIFDDAKPDGEKVLIARDNIGSEIIPYAPAEPLRQELSHFIDCVKNRTSPLTGADEALYTMSLLDGCAKLAAINPDKNAFACGWQKL